MPVDAGIEAAEAERIAQQFVEARRAALSLPAYPGKLPETLAAAYDIQARAIALHGGRIAGWKVGRILPPLDQTFGTNRLAGPIFADTLRQASDEPTMPVFVGGFAAVEAEYVFQLVRFKPAKRQWSLGDALACVTAVHVGFEIASSPFAGINQLGPAVTASDFGNNNGLVIGPRVTDWSDSDHDLWDVALEINGKTTGLGRATAFPDGSAGSVRFALEFLSNHGIAVPDGTWVSSGAITGVHEVETGDQVVARFGNHLQITCHIGAATSTSARMSSK
jgi:2-keto-4-pentenoate hydratase